MAPVSEVMDEDDAVDGVEEDVPGDVPLPPPHGHPGPPGVPLAAAPPHVRVILINMKVKTGHSTCSHFVPHAMPFPKLFLFSL